MNKISKETMLCAISFAIFGMTLGFSFAYDDFHQIHNHPLVVSPELSLNTLIFAFFEPTFPGDLFRPLTVFSYRLNYVLHGLHPFGFHLVNILLHCLCTLLSYRLGSVLLQKKSLAFAGALLFAVHPIHVEAVANVVGRAELLAAAWALLACLVFRSGFYQASRRARMSYFALSGVLIVLGTLSKESSLTILPLVPLFAIMTVGTPEESKAMRNREARTGFLLLCACAALYLMYRSVILDSLFLPEQSAAHYWVENPLIGSSLTERALPALNMLGQYIRLLAVPVFLSADYSVPQPEFSHLLSSTAGILNFLALGLFCFLLFKFRRERWIFFGIWTLVTFAATCNLLVPIGTLFGERLAYLPSVGFCLFIPCALESLFQHSLEESARNRIALAILAVFALRALLRTPVWYDKKTLFQETVLDAPTSPKAKINYGMYLYHDEQDYSGAEPYFREAIQLDPQRPESYHHLINILIFTRRFKRAEYWAHKALQLNPQDAAAQEALNRLLEFNARMEGLLPPPPENKPHETAS